MTFPMSLMLLRVPPHTRPRDSYQSSCPLHLGRLGVFPSFKLDSTSEISYTFYYKS